jgi:hypothetical protein
MFQNLESQVNRYRSKNKSSLFLRIFDACKFDCKGHTPFQISPTKTSVSFFFFDKKCFDMGSLIPDSTNRLNPREFDAVHSGAQIEERD